MGSNSDRHRFGLLVGCSLRIFYCLLRFILLLLDLFHLLLQFFPDCLLRAIEGDTAMVTRPAHRTWLRRRDGHNRARRGEPPMERGRQHTTVGVLEWTGGARAAGPKAALLREMVRIRFVLLAVAGRVRERAVRAGASRAESTLDGCLRLWHRACCWRRMHSSGVLSTC